MSLPPPTVDINIPLTASLLHDICEIPARLGPDVITMVKVGEALTKLVFQAVKGETYHDTSRVGHGLATKIAVPIPLRTFKRIMEDRVKGKEMERIARRTRTAAHRALKDPKYVLPPFGELDDGAARRRRALGPTAEDVEREVVFDKEVIVIGDDEEDENGDEDEEGEVVVTKEVLVVEGDQEEQEDQGGDEESAVANAPVVDLTTDTEQRCWSVIDLSTDEKVSEGEFDEMDEGYISPTAVPEPSGLSVHVGAEPLGDPTGGPEQEEEESSVLLEEYSPDADSDIPEDEIHSPGTISTEPEVSTQQTLAAPQDAVVDTDVITIDQELAAVAEAVEDAEWQMYQDPDFDRNFFRKQVDEWLDGFARAPDTLNDIAKSKEKVRTGGQLARAVGLPSETRKSTRPSPRKRKAEDSRQDVNWEKRQKAEDESLRRVHGIVHGRKLGQAGEDISVIEDVNVPLPLLEKVAYPYELVKGEIRRYLCGHIHDEKPVEWRYLVVTNATTKEWVAGGFCKLTTTKELRDRVKRVLHPREDLELYHRGKLVAKSATWDRIVKYKTNGNEEFIVASIEIATERAWC